MEYIELVNGYKVPMIGYGTLHIPAKQAKDCVTKALLAGYRLIDTASAYQNEKEIGQALKEVDIPRNEIVITTKVWIQDGGYDNTMKAFERSLANLQVDYIDIYLIHQPYGDYYGSWKAMEELYKQGKVKVIGVCNFSPERFVDLWMNSSIHPMINQIEHHPFYQRDSFNCILKQYYCQLEAWGPLNEGQRNIFHHPLLAKIANKHHKSIAQIILRWHIENKMIAIPKTDDEVRMKENIEVFDFKLDEEDKDIIKKLDMGYSEIIDHQNYMTAKWLNSYKIHD